MKTVKRLLIGLVFLGVLLGSAGVAYVAGLSKITTVSMVSAALKGEPLVELRQEPELKALADEMRLDTTLLNLEYGNVQADNVKDNIAAFVSPNTIVIRKDFKNKKLAISHEYMHFVYSRLNESVRADIEKSYLGNKDPWVKQRLSLYKCHTRCMSNEYIAFVCTEAPVYRLTPETLSWCGQFVRRDMIGV